MDPTKLLLVVQIVVQIVLLGFVVFFIVLERKRAVPTSVLDELKDVIKQTQELSDRFHEQVDKKIDIVTKIMDELDNRIQDAKSVMKVLEKTTEVTRQSRQYNQEDVLRLFRGGFTPVDIAQITGIPVGEVQLTIKLRDQNNS
ncbi:MAG TPA: hypothetical protein ENN05_05690 [Deltaproteobacteria bacterium]|nr:hypothetical protein [Deltaproteobacteria bacterium]